MSRVIQTSTTLVTPPTHEPITLAEVKTALKLGSSTSEDALLNGWITAARQMFEEWTGRQVMPATWALWLDDVPAVTQIELPYPPLAEVTAVTYLDSAGAVQTFASSNYTVVAPVGPRAAPGRIVLVSGVSWPSEVTQTPGTLRIEFVAGYVDPTVSPVSPNVPALVKAALYLLVGQLHRFRTPTQEVRGTVIDVPFSLKVILDGLKYSAMPAQVLRTL